MAGQKWLPPEAPTQKMPDAPMRCRDCKVPCDVPNPHARLNHLKRPTRGSAGEGGRARFSMWHVQNVMQLQLALVVLGLANHS